MKDEQDNSDPTVNMNAHVNMRADSVGDGGHFTGLHADHVDNLNVQISKEPRIPLDLPGRPEVLEGREALIQDVLAALAPGKVVTLVGPGGVGKSSLAAEVLWQLCQGKAEPPEAFPDGIFWHSFYHQPEANTALAEIANAFGEDIKEAGGPAQAARLALSGRTALLVLDGAETCARLDEILALRAGCGMLVTTRKSNQSGRICLDIPTLDETSGVQILKAWGGKWADDEIALKKIATLTGGLALALELAGKYIRAHSQRAYEYLAWLEKTPLQALDHGERQSKSVTVLLERSVAGLSEAGKAALGIFGLLGLGSVPTEIFAFGLEVEETEGLRILGELAGLGLAQRVGDTWIMVHPLLHTYAEERIATPVGVLEKLTDRFAQMARMANETGYPSDFNKLEVHVTALAVRAEQAMLIKNISLWNYLGYNKRMIGDYQTARVYLYRALRNAEAAFGLDHPEVATSLNNLGMVLQELGDLSGAKAAFERALFIDEAVFGPDHLNVASIVSNLGSLRQVLGDLLGAKIAFERALRISEVEFGLNHTEVAVRTNNLGLVLKDMGDLNGAKIAIERALKITEEALGSDHPTVAIRVNNLGTVLQDLGDFNGAKAAYERALQIDENTFGLIHPNVARDVNNLGSLLREMGDLQGAKTNIERALRIAITIFGNDHPNVATVYNNLCLVLMYIGDTREARVAIENALSIDEARFGPDHLHVARDISNLGGVLQTVDDLDGAKAAYKSAIQVFEKCLGRDHPDIAGALNSLGIVLQQLGNLSEAKAVYKRGLRIMKKNRLIGHPHTQILRSNLETVINAKQAKHKK